MNKEKKMQIAKNIAKSILIALKNENCFDAFVTRFYTKTKCINYLSDNISKYFQKGNSTLINWNKNTWFDIFDDKTIVEALVFYMTEFNLNKELEES